MGVIVSPHAVIAVDNAAHRLAQQALQTDNAAQATWAGRQGLLATWACEECYNNLMRAAIHQDDRTALDAAKMSWESAASTNPPRTGTSEEYGSVLLGRRRANHEILVEAGPCTRVRCKLQRLSRFRELAHGAPVEALSSARHLKR
jgi:hypothetical protein